MTAINMIQDAERACRGAARMTTNAAVNFEQEAVEFSRIAGRLIKYLD